MEDNNITKFTLESILLHFSKIIHWLIRVIIIEAVIIFLIIAGFFWYVSLPVEYYEKAYIENETGNATYVGNDMNGDLYNGEDN